MRHVKFVCALISVFCVCLQFQNLLTNIILYIILILQLNFISTGKKKKSQESQQQFVCISVQLCSQQMGAGIKDDKQFINEVETLHFKLTVSLCPLAAVSVSEISTVAGQNGIS